MDIVLWFLFHQIKFECIFFFELYFEYTGRFDVYNTDIKSRIRPEANRNMDGLWGAYDPLSKCIQMNYIVKKVTELCFFLSSFIVNTCINFGSLLSS